MRLAGKTKVFTSDKCVISSIYHCKSGKGISETRNNTKRNLHADAKLDVFSFTFPKVQCKTFLGRFYDIHDVQKTRLKNVFKAFSEATGFELFLAQRAMDFASS